MNLEELKEKKIEEKKNRWTCTEYMHGRLKRLSDMMVNSGHIDISFSLDMLEWRTFGDTPSEAMARAKEIVAGAEPMRIESIRFDAFYMRYFFVVPTEGTYQGEWLPVTKCTYCNGPLDTQSGVCSKCAMRAGIKGNASMLGEADARKAQYLDRAFGLG